MAWVQLLIDLLLCAQVQTILMDSKCQELWSLLQSAQQTSLITNQDVIRYRREAEMHVGQDDNLYRLQWVRLCLFLELFSKTEGRVQVRDSKTVKVQLMGAEDPSVSGVASATNRWREYAHTYVMRHPTEWVGKDEKNAKIFLSR